MAGDAVPRTSVSIPGQPGWDRCPGCGVELPGDGSLTTRAHASAACWQLYGELAGYESQHIAELGAHHQLMVDAYAAQHAGGTTRAIGTAFALIGLSLALDHGWTAVEIRDAHQWLAEHHRGWPTFPPPAASAAITVEDVALTGSPRQRVAALATWADAVWRSWRPQHEAVAALLDLRLPADVRARLSHGS